MHSTRHAQSAFGPKAQTASRAHWNRARPLGQPRYVPAMSSCSAYVTGTLTCCGLVYSTVCGLNPLRLSVVIIDSACIRRTTYRIPQEDADVVLGRAHELHFHETRRCSERHQQRRLVIFRSVHRRSTVNSKQDHISVVVVLHEPCHLPPTAPHALPRRRPRPCWVWRCGGGAGAWRVALSRVGTARVRFEARWTLNPQLPRCLSPRHLKVSRLLFKRVRR